MLFKLSAKKVPVLTDVNIKKGRQLGDLTDFLNVSDIIYELLKQLRTLQDFNGLEAAFKTI